MVRSTCVDADHHRQLFRREERRWRRRSNVQLLDVFVDRGGGRLLTVWPIRLIPPRPAGPTAGKHKTTDLQRRQFDQKVQKFYIWQNLDTGVASAAPFAWIIVCVACNSASRGCNGFDCRCAWSSSCPIGRPYSLWNSLCRRGLACFWRGNYCVFRLVTEKINEKSDDVDFFAQCPSVWDNEIDENKNNVKVILDPYRP